MSSPLSRYAFFNSKSRAYGALLTEYGAIPLYFRTNELISDRAVSWYNRSRDSHSESRHDVTSASVSLGR